jgi:hypothetical protein
MTQYVENFHYPNPEMGKKIVELAKMAYEKASSGN